MGLYCKKSIIKYEMNAKKTFNEEMNCIYVNKS